MNRGYHLLLFFLVYVSLTCLSREGLSASVSRDQAPDEGWVNKREGAPSSPPLLHYLPTGVVNTTAGGKPLGQVTAVSIAPDGHLVLFHRGSHVWDESSFSDDNLYRKQSDGPIMTDTVIEYDADYLLPLTSWGSGMFYMPHGLTVDHEGNYWVTDVALHQVFKFDKGQPESPSLVLGQKFTPGSGRDHFCKPTSVAICPHTGNFFVADGYCNSRVIMFDPTGKYIREWGEKPDMARMFDHSHQPSPLEFMVPHKIVMNNDDSGHSHGVCVADREHGRVQCIDNTTNGQEVIQSVSSPLFNGRVFSVAISCGLMFIATGPSFINEQLPVKAFVVDMNSGQIVSSFAPQQANQTGTSFHQPHDIVPTPDCSSVFVSEIGPNAVWRFTKEGTELPASVSTTSGNSSTLVVISVMSLVVVLLFSLYRLYNRRITARYSATPLLSK